MGHISVGQGSFLTLLFFWKMILSELVFVFLFFFQSAPCRGIDSFWTITLVGCQLPSNLSWHTKTVVYFWSVDRVVSSYDDGNWRKLSSDSLIPQLWKQWAALPSSPPRTHTPPPPPPFQQLENELSFDRLRRKLLNIHFQLMISFAVNKKNKSIIQYRS